MRVLDLTGDIAVVMTKLFTNYNTWLGGYYELAIEVGPTSDSHLLSVLEAAWIHPSLEGGYLDRHKEPNEQSRVQILPDLLSQTHIQGIALLPNGCRVACGTCLIREEDGGPDWLDFYLPLGSLGEAYDLGAYPFDELERSPDDWQTSIDHWLSEMSRDIYSRSSFRLALIGFEVSGNAYSGQIEKEGIPSQRRFGYVWPEGNRVEYFPRNMSGA